MKRIESRPFAGWPIVATALAAVFLGLLTLSGFASPSSGDLAVTAPTIRGMTWAILLATLLLVGLALGHMARRRLAHARMTQASTTGAGCPRRKPWPRPISSARTTISSSAVSMPSAMRREPMARAK